MITRTRQATSRPVHRSNAGQMVRRLAVLVVLGVVAGCTAPAEEVRPPEDQIFFPTGVTVSPDEAHLFVISANSQLKYDSGTIGVVDLAAVDTAIANWTGAQHVVPDGCSRDDTLSDVINCDAKNFLLPGAGVRIGNFAATIGVQDRGGGDLRLIVPVRGDPSVTWIDWNASSNRLQCASAEGFELCDNDHRLTHMFDDDILPQVDVEPYNVFVDSQNDYAVVTHLASGTATLVDLFSKPQLTDEATGLFAADVFQRVGSVGVAGRRPGDPDDMVYVTSLSENRVQTFTVARPNGGAPVLVEGNFFFLDRIGNNGHASSDTRAVAFGSGGDRAYFMNRLPPSLAIFDTSVDPRGYPKNQLLAGTDLCRQGVSLVVGDVGEGERAYVTCFQDGEVYVVDPRDGATVEQVSTVGRGPFGAALAPGRKRLYVTNFYENTVAVVDLTPGAATQYRVVLRIGVPSSQ